MATLPPAAAALLQPCRAPRLRRLLPHLLYFNNVVGHGRVASVSTGSTWTMMCTTITWSPSRTFSTSPTPCIRAHGLSTRLVVRSYWLYFAYVVHSVTWSLRPTCCLVALALLRLCCLSGRMVSPPDLLSGRTGSTSSMPCVLVSLNVTTSPQAHEKYRCSTSPGE
jgi:hypothetical protein